MGYYISNKKMLGFVISIIVLASGMNKFGMNGVESPSSSGIGQQVCHKKKKIDSTTSWYLIGTGMLGGQDTGSFCG
jgi:hypothetical protein